MILTLEYILGSKSELRRRDSSLWLIGLMVITLIGLASCSNTVKDQKQANIELVQRYMDEVWSQGKVSVIDEIIGDGYVKHWAAYEPTIGRDELKTWVKRLRNSFPDWNERIDAIHASGDMVFVRWTESGTFYKDLHDVAATNKQVTISGMGWTRISGGKIVEEWTIVDNWGMQRQLGVVYPDEWLEPGWE